MMLSAPLVFSPWLRPMPWGGSRLSELFDSTLAGLLIGEAWLLSSHRLHQSLGMDQAGSSLTSVFQPGTPFPLLVKILDAQQNLSVQVHPDDELAKTWSPSDGGKTEAWYVLEAGPQAAIYLGVKAGMDHDAVRRELASGNIVSCLKRYEPKAGETYYLPAGTLHALGQDLLVLEVQQTSDATFRMYDWGRTGPGGKARELHLEAGMACLKLSPEGAGLQQPVILSDGVEQLVKSPYFTLNRHRGWRVEVAGPAVVIPWNGSLVSEQDGSVVHPGHACLVPATINQIIFAAQNDNMMVFEIRWPT